MLDGSYREEISPEEVILLDKPIKEDDITTVNGRTKADFYQKRYNRMTDYRELDDLAVLTSWKGTALEHSLYPSCLAFAVGLVVVYLHYFHPVVLEDMRISLTAHTMGIIPVAFLLVVRTDMSWERFWEGTRSVQDLIVHSRNLTSKAMAYVKGDSPEAKKVRCRIFQYTLVFFITVRHNVYKRSAGVRGSPEEYSGYIAPEEQEFLKKMKQNRPLMLMDWLRRSVAEAKHNNLFRTDEAIEIIDSDVQALTRAWAHADTICNSPMPLPYAHLIQVLLYVWILTLPFAFSGLIGTVWAIPFLNLVTAVTLFGIDGMGQELEDPFGSDYNDIPLETFEQLLHDDLVYTSCMNNDDFSPDFDMEHPFQTSQG